MGWWLLQTLLCRSIIASRLALFVAHKSTSSKHLVHIPSYIPDPVTKRLLFRRNPAYLRLPRVGLYRVDSETTVSEARYCPVGCTVPPPTPTEDSIQLCLVRCETATSITVKIGRAVRLVVAFPRPQQAIRPRSTAVVSCRCLGLH